MPPAISTARRSGAALTTAGTVFELSPNGSGGWTETVLYNFCSQLDCADGYFPFAGLIFDAVRESLRHDRRMAARYFGGTVFELSPNGSGGWTETVLHSFSANGTDGAYPYAGLIFDAAAISTARPQEVALTIYGTVFELTPTGAGWMETVLHSFNNNGTDGATPYAGLILDRSGNLYGTTEYGGTDNSGTVFEITP